MTIKTSPKKSIVFTGNLNITFANTIAKKEAKRLMYNADITANL
jgi:hypothetical protein